MKIERPDWHQFIHLEIGEWTLANAKTKSELANWFDQKVEPINKMLSEGAEVYSFDPPKTSTRWSPQWGHDESEFDHKGLLINIQPIKKETAEDVLKALIDYEDNIPDAMKPEYESIYERAKAVLDDQTNK